MDQRSKIPALALLGLSFTQCTGREQAGDPIVGDWRAVQVDGEKHPKTSYVPGVLIGEQLRIDDDLGGEMARYQSGEYEGFVYGNEAIAELVVDASAAPKYRIDVAHDFFEVYEYEGPVEPPGYDDYGDGSGDPDTGPGDTGDEPSPLDDELGPVRPLALPTTPDLAPGALIFDCTLEGDTLTCDREGASELKRWVFTRIEPDGG